MSAVHNIAPRVLVYPSGSPAPATEEGWVALPLLPSAPGSPAVFGDGSHPTTRLCAAALDLLCRQHRARSPTLSEQRLPLYPAVLDVGTGTGILARIARARDAGFIVGTDIDPAALSCARAHAQLDHHSRVIEFSSEPPDHWGARFDLVVANILQGPLESLAPALCRALAPEGILLISGFTRPQVPSLRVVYEKAGVTFRGQSILEEWTLLTFASQP
jgi:ribosomal protein L11 methyltransferase